MKIIGVAGGSGSGKSTVSYALVDSDPDQFDVLNLDDYHKHRDDPGLPKLHGMINWDHPDIMRWDDLIADVNKLKSGKAITVATKDRRFNPDYPLHRKTVKRVIESKPFIIVDGYLALYNPALFKLFDKSFYLDLDEATRLKRRDKSKLIPEPDYPKKVLIPMHEKYVEPTKQNANVIIDVSNLEVDQIADRIKEDLEQ